MKTEMFGIKITKCEKGAIQFISQRCNRPASKLLYDDLLDAVKTKLGLTLLFDIGHPGDLDDAFATIITNPGPFHRRPQIIESFLEIIERKGMKTQFRSIFNTITFEDRGFLLYEIDLRDLARTIGSEYLAQHGSFDPVRLDLVYDIFFDHILSLYYQLTAVGSLKDLQEQWSFKQGLVRSFKQRIKQIYQTEYEEPVEVTEELIVVEALPTPPTPKRAGGSASEPRTASARTEKDRAARPASSSAERTDRVERRKRTRKKAS